MSDYETARRNMVENQLRPSRIVQPELLAAMGRLPRELFVPKLMRGVAYADEDVPLGDGAFLVEPLALAKLVQSAAVGKGDVVLVIGDLSGYAAAVLAHLAATVMLLLPPERDTAALEALLTELGLDTVVVQRGDPMQGLPDQAPFDLVALVGSVSEVPPGLLSQVGPNGRLVAVTNVGRSGKVTVYKSIGNAVGRTTPFDANMPPVPGFRTEPAFSL